MNENQAIPENIFIDNNEPKIKMSNNSESSNSTSVGEISEKYDINYLYNFLEKDFQIVGYNDALANPDMSNMENNVLLIRNRLEIVLAKVNTYYNSTMRTLNFHIESRSRNGMVDIVGELEAKKANLEEEIIKVKEIEEGAKNKRGLSEAMIMSYVLGFKNGYAAISHSQLLNNL
jgi:hypothetical protein